jgi:hypothetical protein
MSFGQILATVVLGALTLSDGALAKKSRRGGAFLPVTTLHDTSSYPCGCEAYSRATNSPLQLTYHIVSLLRKSIWSSCWQLTQTVHTGPSPPPRTVNTSSAKCSVIANGYSEVSNKKAIAAVSTLSHISPLFSVRSTDRKKTLYLCGSSLPPLPLALLERTLP